MHFDPPLESAILLRRYKRFLADIQLPDNSIRTIHCANTGTMTGCAEPGDTVWFSTSDSKKRKYANSWELTETRSGHMICVNTARANPCVVEAITTGVIPELDGYTALRTEVRYGQENSRIDILLQAEGRPDCYVEVKSVTLLAQNGQGYFPDSVTTRGQKHLRELAAIAASGQRAVLVFAVLHSGIEQVAAAKHIDTTYHQLMKDAAQVGVEIICYKATISFENISLEFAVPLSHS